MKHLLFILFLFIFINSSFSQESEKQKKRSYKWEKVVSYNNDSTIKIIEKDKRLRVIDFTTMNTQCSIRIKKEYKAGVCVNKEYSTLTSGGCFLNKNYKHEYKKRFPNFLFYRTKVFLASLGFKSLIYK